MTEIDFAYFNYEHGGLVAGRIASTVLAAATASMALCGLLVIRAVGRTF